MSKREQTVLRERAAVILHGEGMSNREIALALGLSYPGACNLIRNGGAAQPHAATRERNAEIVRRYQSGEGYRMEDIAQEFGLTRARVQQILAKAGISVKDYVVPAIVLVNKAEDSREHKAALERHWDEKTQSIYGCSAARLTELNGGLPRSRAGSPAYFYVDQRRNSLTRGIEWAISFPDWWQLWQDSGHWDERGRGAGKYCMARIGDSGNYAVGNVEIITTSQNSSDSYLITSAQARRGKALKTADHLSDSQLEAANFIARGITHIEASKIWGISRVGAWQRFDAVKKKLALRK